MRITRQYSDRDSIRLQFLNDPWSFFAQFLVETVHSLYLTSPAHANMSCVQDFSLILRRVPHEPLLLGKRQAAQYESLTRLSFDSQNTFANSRSAFFEIDYGQNLDRCIVVTWHVIL